jgi:hypothetical protein
MSRDPKGMIDGPNVYAGHGGDPINRTDPMGTDSEWNGTNWVHVPGTPFDEVIPSRPGKYVGERIPSATLALLTPFLVTQTNNVFPAIASAAKVTSLSGIGTTVGAIGLLVITPLNEDGTPMATGLNSTATPSSATGSYRTAWENYQFKRYLQLPGIQPPNPLWNEPYTPPPVINQPRPVLSRTAQSYLQELLRHGDSFIRSTAKSSPIAGGLPAGPATIDVAGFERLDEEEELQPQTSTAGAGRFGGKKYGPWVLRINGMHEVKPNDQPTINQENGNKARDEFADHLRANGMDVVGTEVYINTPGGARIADIVVRVNNQLHGIEVKSGNARVDPLQYAKDRIINTHGGSAYGQRARDGNIEGEIIKSMTTIHVR